VPLPTCHGTIKQAGVAPVGEGLVDLGNRLRPNLRSCRPILFVRAKPNAGKPSA
jgi:hypothetical protein